MGAVSEATFSPHYSSVAGGGIFVIWHIVYSGQNARSRVCPNWQNNSKESPLFLPNNVEKLIHKIQDIDQNGS